MTCIVAIAKDGVVYMGGDRQVTSGEMKYAGDAKIHLMEWNGRPEFVVGDAGGTRIGNLIKTITIDGDDFGDPYLNIVNGFIPVMRSKLINNGSMCKFNDGSDQGNDVLVGHRGRLFHIDSSFGVNEPADGYFASGNSREIVLGALFAMSNSGTMMHPRNMIETAMKAAEKYSRGVSGPFDFLELPK